MENVKAKKVHNEIMAIWVAVLSISSVSLATEGIWTRKADMPTARMLLGTCVVDGKIYAIGGAPAPHMHSPAVEEYDPETDTWTRKAPMPTPRGGLGVGAVNGKIYAIGGAERSVGIMEEYDPVTDTWTRKADMPTARGFLSTSAVDGKIYAIGGALDTSGPAFTAVEEYDPATDTWTRKTDMPERRFMHTAGVVGGVIYIIAGSWQSYTASSAVFAYDTATDSWTRKADAPAARSWQSPTAGVVDGRIYVVGGDFGPPDATVVEYDPETDIWTTRADMPTPRGALSITGLNDRFYVIGGTVTLFNDTLSTVEEYYPNPLFVDFNGDGTVNISEILQIIKSWGQDDLQCDVAPRPSGDGIVDAQDLQLIMGFWNQTVDDSTLVAHWALDESEGSIALDCAGGHEGYIIGDPIWEPAGGQVDGAISLDGIDDHIVAGLALNPADGPFSVFAWVQGGAPGQTVISQFDGVNWLGADSASGCLTTELRASGRGGVPLLSAVNITDGFWHRIGLVWDGAYRVLYVDDVPVAEDTQRDLEGCAGGLKIGGGVDSAARTFWSGLIDEIRIYNRAVNP